MEAHDKDIQFLKDIWADPDQREVTKRVIAIGLGRINKGVTLDVALALGDVLDDMLKEEEEREFSNSNMTI